LLDKRSHITAGHREGEVTVVVVVETGDMVVVVEVGVG